MIKHATNIPCPSCGATRSVISFMNGHFIESLYWNPLGILLAVLMFVTPVWIIIDFLYKRDSLFSFYHRTERFLKKRSVAIPAILLVIANWIWNISKGL